MSNDQIDYEAVRQRAEKRVQARAEFIMHLAIYIIVNLALWGLWFIFAPREWFPLPVISTVVWGIGVAIHGADSYIKFNMMDTMREQAIQREVEHEIRLRGQNAQPTLAKPKREQAVRLSDDGELLPVEDENVSKSKRSNR